MTNSEMDFDRFLGAGASGALRANRFIVTVYGDVVEPRGGSLWMGSLIDCCAQQGISESLVRTAVSRLVSSGHLQGDRVGRKSYYRLTQPAREEFAQAARLFYDPLPEPTGWLICLDQDGTPGQRWGQLGPRSYIASDVEGGRVPNGVVLRAVRLPESKDMHELGQSLWPLADLAQQYGAFVACFGPLRDRLSGGQSVTSAQALALRLRMVHRYRQVVLDDPRLPATALGPDWAGFAARRLFAETYLLLSDLADQEAGNALSAEAGRLDAVTPAIQMRLQSVKRLSEL